MNQDFKLIVLGVVISLVLSLVFRYLKALRDRDNFIRDMETRRIQYLYKEYGIVVKDIKDRYGVTEYDPPYTSSVYTHFILASGFGWIVGIITFVLYMIFVFIIL